MEANEKMVSFSGMPELCEELGVRVENPEDPQNARFYLNDDGAERRIFIGDLLFFKNGVLTYINGVVADGLEIHNMAEN